MGPSPAAISGKRAENAACQFLMQHGLRPVIQNYTRRFGELDIVCLHDNELVFVEVRYRQQARFTAPAITVDRHKQRKLIRAAALFLAHHPRYANHVCRFDVVAVTGDTYTDCTWIRDAFRPADSNL